MSLTFKGVTSLTLESNGTLSTDRYGLSSATARWFSLAEINGVPIAFGSKHPVWNFLSCDKVNVSHEAPYWKVEASYFGIADEGVSPIYELDVSVSDEPIETHPDFVSDLGGTPASPLNGAKFDENGIFLGFSAGADWIGVRSYLSPGAVWRETSIQKSVPANIADLGLISSPAGPVPAVESGRNWLFWNMTWQQKGLIYVVRKEWRLSGRRGWNATIYG